MTNRETGPRQGGTAERAGAEASSPGSPTRSILCAVDFSRTSHAALEHALSVAARSGATLHVVCALEPPLVALPETSSALAEATKMRRDLEAALASLVAHHRERGVAIEGRVVPGAPVLAICDEARRLGAELIVLGTHGRTGLARLALGSVAERVVRAATVSTLTVPLVTAAEATAPRPIRVVLTALDLSGDEDRVLRAALELAGGAAVRVVHVRGHAPGASGARAEEDRELEAVVRRVAGPGANVTWRTRGGVPHEAILAEARECDADCIVVGAHRHGALAHILLGSVAVEVVRGSRVPVLVFRPPPPSAHPRATAGIFSRSP